MGIGRVSLTHNIIMRTLEPVCRSEMNQPIGLKWRDRKRKPVTGASSSGLNSINHK